MAQTAFILVLTADEARGQRLRELLREQYEQSCKVVSSLEEARESIRQRVPDAIVADASINGNSTVASLADVLVAAAPDAALLVLGEAKAAPLSRRVRFTTLPADAPPDQLARQIVQAAGKAVARREDRLLELSLIHI